MTGLGQDIVGHQPDMRTFEEFQRSLQDALAHLYDPAYRPAEILWIVTGCDPQQGPETFQAALVQAIEDLKPGPHVPPTALSRRIYGLLTYRYVQDLTQEETAAHVGITPRHLRRQQPQAVHALALRLWEQRPELAVVEGPEYRSQVMQELVALRKSAPEAVASVGEAVETAVRLGDALTSKRGVHLEAKPVEPALVAATHPSVLHQVLIQAVGQLARQMSSGQITLDAEGVGENVIITVSGCPVAASSLPIGEFAHQILADQGGTADVLVNGDRVTLTIDLPSADVIVLVVDDNADLVHLYRRYAVGTRYHIMHTGEGQRVFDIVQASPPDVVVLDVMLPDVDGWELLADLHEHPATRPIPVIVCSVVREADLAMALGAALYVPKPVERERFIQALDRVTGRAD